MKAWHDAEDVVLGDESEGNERVQIKSGRVHAAHFATPPAIA